MHTLCNLGQLTGKRVKQSLTAQIFTKVIHEVMDGHLAGNLAIEWQFAERDGQADEFVCCCLKPRAVQYMYKQAQHAT